MARHTKARLSIKCSQCHKFFHINDFEIKNIRQKKGVIE